MCQVLESWPPSSNLCYEARLSDSPFRKHSVQGGLANDAGRLLVYTEPISIRRCELRSTVPSVPLSRLDHCLFLPCLLQALPISPSHHHPHLAVRTPRQR